VAGGVLPSRFLLVPVGSHFVRRAQETPRLQRHPCIRRWLFHSMKPHTSNKTALTWRRAEPTIRELLEVEQDWRSSGECLIPIVRF
jgi:hypothetical protein